MKKLLPFLFLFFAFNLFSQKEANFWYFGERGGLDFTTNPPNPISGALNTDEGSASISNANGELQFYTDGSVVYNRNDEVMTNGTGLLGDSSSAQSAIIVPKPLSDTIYYIFTVGNQLANDNQGNGVAFSEVDMSLSNGLGAVITKNTPLVSSQLAREKITAVRGSECNTFWVITSDRNRFYAYLIDSNGVNNGTSGSPRISAHNNNLNNLRGYLKISPNGKTLVNASASSGSYIFDFNAQNGEITNGGTLNIDGDGYGVEFSRNGEKLYVTTGTFSQFTNQGTRNNPDYASVTQLSLTSRDIFDINASKKLIYETNSGYRGALQLAANGKIYYARSRENFLGVINFPENDFTNTTANEIGFEEEGLFLNSRISTEGLPPFIQSFFLPIEIRDTDTNEVLNDQNLQYCVGEDRVLQTEAVNGSNIIYSWTFTDSTDIPIDITPSTNPETLTLTNLQVNNTGEYSLKIELTDDCNNEIIYNGTFNIEVFEAAVATQPADIIFCDTDRDGFNAFDLENLKNNEILNGLNPDTFEVLYYTTEANALSNSDALPKIYTNPTAFSSETIYARVHNKQAMDACFEITNFTLAVTDLPVPTQPEPYRICDNLESTSDTDGVINTFLLNTKDSEIYGNLDSSKYNLTYHTTQIGADTNDTTTLIDKNTNYSVTNSQTVFIRIENKDNTDCYDAETTLELIVDPLPVITPEVDLLQCDDDLDRISTVNLTEAEISISANSANERFEYFATEADAIAGTPLVDDELRYPVNQNGEAWVRTISSEDCYRISKINLEVEAAADVAYNKEFEAVCDDFLQTDGTNGPANDDTDGITNFDFSEANAEILAFFPPALRPDLEISFYETRDDRTAVVNAIADISNYRNINFPSDVTRQTIYFKITNKNNNNCSGTGELYLRTNTVPEAANVPDLELCDDANDGDGTNGIVQSFDLESQTAAILNGQNPADFTVTYHLSAADANAGFDAQSSPFANTTRDSQTIFVRVTNTTTGCFTDHTSFNVIVNPIPVANFVEDLEICDDNSDGSARNGFSQAIDLESQTAGILGTQNPNMHTVTYHRSLADAQNGNNPLISPYSNNAPNRETIFVRILNKDTGCANPISNFDVIVNAEPVFVVPTNLAYCDNDLDGDDANGIVQNIDLDSKITEILGTTQNPNDFNVTFHNSQANATSGNDAIISPYQNTNATETIFVRIENKNTGCVNDDANFDVIVNTLPDFTVTTPQILCLNDLPLNIAAENARDVYSYIWQDENGTVLNTASRDNINITSGGTYTVTATTTDGTLCERSESIVVNESNPATLERDFITIIDEGNNISSEANLSISIDIVNNDLGPGNYQFAIVNTDDNSRIPIIGFQDEPLFENLEGGVYQIIVNDKNGCAPDEMLLVSVIQFPKFFTPNGDGRNDTWVVKGANKDFYPNASINIFNRYGTLVAQEQIDSEGWNGMYQGKLLPSDDYWFNITLIPADTTKPTINKKGNFSLLRK
ncbi:T9SS type B sorting domain-containing protein [Polaribacter sp. Hel_I_88]|uniref:T9SS type B sorting domain-containing protein n=1 Tax=Polaribacter sp. Hel_I_88 TaxID=1250006 RepID=UPI00047E1D75|nr:T9SS type B sorting domain-containing protein [Polaribacter sp. Hel_I_88]